MNTDVRTKQDEEVIRAAVIVAVEHFLGNKKFTGDQIFQALQIIGIACPYELLGRLAFVAMVKTDLARLQARLAILGAEISTMRKPSIH